MRAWLALIFVLAPAPVLAQKTPGPPLPIGMDLRKAPVGSWAEYTINIEQFPPLRQRLALVARDGQTHAIEMTSQGGAPGAGGRVVIRAVIDGDPASKDPVRSLVVQIDDNEPMGLPRDHFAPPRPKKLVAAKKAVEVPAGSFTARHYKDRTRSGLVELWASDAAPPFGIVKLAGTVAQGLEDRYPLTMELVRQGTDAQPVVTRPARPYDQGEMTRQMRKAFTPPGKEARK